MAEKTTKKEEIAVSRKREMQGVVVSKSGDKTVAVSVARTVRHPIYQKKMKQTKRYLVHDPENVAEVGQTVTIQEARRLSARKRWILVPKS